MIDIHMHLIFGVDDGATDFNMAKDLLSIAFDEGIRHIIATPHNLAVHSTLVQSRFEALKRYIEKNYPSMMLGLGSEVLLTKENVDTVIAQVESGLIPTMNGTKYVLTEYHPDVQYEEIEYIHKKLYNRNYIPIIAHAEKYISVFSDQTYIRNIKDAGALIQINAYSIVEEQNLAIKHVARQLLSQKFVDFVGSDAHRSNRRPPKATAGIQYIMTHCEYSYAEAILQMNARKYLKMYKDILTDGMYGLAVADAMGVPYESCTLEEMYEDPCSGMIGYRHHNQPAGSWSDDTSMSLCIADSLCTGIDTEDIMKKFILWKDHKQYTATGVLFDIGRQTRRALNRYLDGYPAEYCGENTENANGNGGLMRCFPIAYYQCVNCPADDEHLEQFLDPVHAVSQITHGHEIGLICCGLFSLVLREWMNCSQPQDTLAQVVERAYEKARYTYSHMGGRFSEFISDRSYFPNPTAIMHCRPEELPSWGYSLNTWNIALWSLLNTDNYRDCVLRAVNLGGDTDTNAAVAGALAGAIYGKDTIPSEWIDALQNKRLIDSICNKLYAVLFHRTQEVSVVIDKFEEQYAFLSMKTSTRIDIDGEIYPNTAIAYYTLGVTPEHRNEFVCLNIKQARKRYKDLPHTDESEADRLYTIVRSRFYQNPAEAKKLMNTGNLNIVYDTTGGHDNTLGRCRCPQCKDKDYDNLYGKVLMKVRAELFTEHEG